MTCHINVKYFFVTVLIKEGEMKIEYLPTLYTISDYLTKPSQGILFQKPRNIII